MNRTIYRNILILLFLPAFAAAYSSPGSPMGYVNDFAGLLKPETVVNLNENLKAYEDAVGHQITVVTVPNLSGDYIENYAVRLFEEWGIGSKEHDNGLLLLIARDEREVRIEVGYGLEGAVTDIASGHVISDIITPAFQAGNYDQGVRDAVGELEKLASGEAVDHSSTNVSRINGQIIYLSIFALMFLGSILARSKSWWAGGVVGAIAGWIFFTGLPIIIILALVGLVFDYFVTLA